MTWPFAHGGPPVAAVPRQLPLSPDLRAQGQGRTMVFPAVGGKAPWHTVVEAAIPVPGTVSVRPQSWDPATEPDIIGQVRVRVSPPGGSQLERVEWVPGWGMSLDIPSGITTVEVANYYQAPWEITAAPGLPTRKWSAHERGTQVPAAGAVFVIPPAFATLARFSLLDGDVAFGTPASPIVAAPFDRVVPASRLTITGGVSALSNYLLAWEIFA